MKHFFLLIAVICGFSNILSAKANESLITKTLIVEKNQQMEQLLEKRDPKETINFLHSRINDRAIFKIEVSNPTLPAQAGTRNFEMDKKDYINSFINGLHYVDQYNVTINTLDIQISPDQKSAVVSEKMTEEGVMLNAQAPQKAGIPFSSTTKCQTTYIINNGVMQSDNALCKTQTAELSAI
jgi:hypothetical protein